MNFYFDSIADMLNPLGNRNLAYIYFSKIKVINQGNSTILLPPDSIPPETRKGVIQFVGGFLSGSLPIAYCGRLLACLCKRGYTVAIYRFSLFQTNHINIVRDLYAQQLRIKETLTYKFSQDSVIKMIYANDFNYHWLAYSMGCRLVTLLEILSGTPSEKADIFNGYLTSFSTRRDQEFVHEQLTEYLAEGEPCYIRNQRSIFLAPEITNTINVSKSIRGESLDLFWQKDNNAGNNVYSIEKLLATLQGLIRNIPYEPLADLEIEIFPDSERIKFLVRKAFQYLFGITKIIHFEQDKMSFDDIDFFRTLEKTRENSHFEIKVLKEGGHNTPCSANEQKILDVVDEISNFFVEHVID